MKALLIAGVIFLAGCTTTCGGNRCDVKRIKQVVSCMEKGDVKDLNFIPRCHVQFDDYSWGSLDKYRAYDARGQAKICL